VSGPRFTLYANSNDKALRASDGLHGAARLGEGGERITVMPDVDSIDASHVKTDFIGHSYFGDTETLLSDLFHLIRTGAKPEDRFRLEPATHRDGKYWRFRR
jgi:esterase/lipase superfamily enzyme